LSPTKQDFALGTLEKILKVASDYKMQVNLDDITGAR